MYWRLGCTMKVDPVQPMIPAQVDPRKSCPKRFAPTVGRVVMWKTSCWMPEKTGMIYYWVKWGETREITVLPSGKLTVCYGKSPCLMRKSSINVPFSMAMLVYQGNWFSWGDAIFVGSHFLFPSPRWWSWNDWTTKHHGMTRFVLGEGPWSCRQCTNDGECDQLISTLHTLR